MKLKSKKLFYVKAAVIAVAVVVLIAVTKPAFLWVTPIAIILGYLFGKITCGVHFKKFGVVITIAVFVALNFFHSLVDGVAFVSVVGVTQDFAVYGHELIRQPLLYIILFAILEPFEMNRYMKWGIAFISITIIWFFGYRLGASLAGFASTIPEAYLAQGIYFFIGDIVHHIADEYGHTFSNLQS